MAKKVQKKKSDTPGWHTRSDVARILGVAKTTVRRLEGVELHPVRKNGVQLFDPVAVSKYAEARQRKRPPKMGDGELAAVLFEKFGEGKSLDEIVRELRIAPRIVKDLFCDWKTDLEVLYIQRTDAGAVK